jgi:hypothetical protein
LPSQPQISDPARLNRPTRPIAQLEGRDPHSEKRHADRFVGNVGREVKADKAHMEAADKEADREQPEALRPKRFLQRVHRAKRGGHS